MLGTNLSSSDSDQSAPPRTPRASRSRGRVTSDPIPPRGPFEFPESTAHPAMRSSNHSINRRASEQIFEMPAHSDPVELPAVGNRSRRASLNSRNDGPDPQSGTERPPSSKGKQRANGPEPAQRPTAPPVSYYNIPYRRRNSQHAFVDSDPEQPCNGRSSRSRSSTRHNSHAEGSDAHDQRLSVE
jgi:hypothetical protein